MDGLLALVTGASRGIGKAIAKALAGEGADVIINYRSSDDDADRIAVEIEGLGKNTWVYCADVSDIGQVRRMRESVETHVGNVDILINNAGINRDKLFSQMDEDIWKEVISVNLNGVFNCTRIFLDHLKQSKRPRIINIASIVGQMGNIGQANYAASKAGLIGMTKTLAKELAREGITVNAVAPGFIETDMFLGIRDEIKEKILSSIPLRRFGLPREVALAVVYLASDDADYITGHVLNINGGMYL
ncbi:MAG: 3-oxoacyl-[acyl-carrier-protein] reductase [Thermoplasmata archaeon]